ncbi:MAG TPA: anhydro-N-acetylmuramic acid kinase [Thermoanaerobaculia bacterium]|nr:anhydro-N-acetylmuramic acid kinase [Thermoanaerobaculia bacterium]
MNRLDRLVHVTRKPARRVVGIMSGTSVDGIDAALTEIEGHGESARVRLVAFRSYPFPPDIRAEIFRLFDPASAKISELCHLDFLLGELFAAAVTTLLDENGLGAGEIDLIGTAGQTVWHDPQPIRRDTELAWVGHPIETRSTLAIGQSAVIAERTGIITVGDLRVRDVAAGGHGAPLIAYADWILLRDPVLGRCIQNIGGIGNVTYLAPGGGLEDVIAFDTGPGNMVIDALAEVATGGRMKYDVDGRIAASGRVREEILQSWMEDPYFSKQPPKTTGREHFGAQFVRRMLTEAQGIALEDLIATATALTATSIARSYHDFVEPRGSIDEVVLGGGGASNPNLIAHLRTLLPDVRIVRHEDLGIDSGAKEAIAIAIIANDSVMGMSTNVPGATGGRPTVLGKINL